MAEANQAQRKALWNSLVSLAVTIVIMLALLFIPAGTIGSLRGQWFVAAFIVAILISIVVLWRANPDILAELARSERRPRLLIGFAAETKNVAEAAGEKRLRKGADWILANDVSGDVMGGDDNEIHLITAEGEEVWAKAPKAEIARRLARRIADALA